MKSMENFVDKTKRILELVKRRSKYRLIFDSDHGRDVLRDICRMGCVTRSSMSSNPNQLLREAHYRELALMILKRAVQDPQAFISQSLTEEKYNE